MSKCIITINRMFGSGGRIIGKALAEELGFKFYDKELIEMASKEKNIPFDEFARVDEKKASQWLYPVDYELQMNPEYHFVPMNDVLYDLQKKSILEAADKENCVIVGRCGNYILKDYKDKHIQPVGVCEIFIISTALFVSALHHLANTLFLTSGTGHYRFHSLLKRCIDEQADMLILIIF